MTKCPYCGRTLREHERYCDFCEQDITKYVEEAEKPKITKKEFDFKGNIKKIKETSKAIFSNIKKKLKREK